MTPERWKQVNDLFHAVLECGGDQAAFLDAATENDPELRREVLTLLASHRASHDFLETPAWGVAPELILGDEPTLVGRTVGVYNVLREIGRGGMGVVYAAEDTRLGRRVALKALSPDLLRDPAGRERLRREARAAAALTHPAIATVFALEELDGELYIASELVEGRTLRQEITHGPLPPDLLRTTLLEIADALAAAHAQGIVHRDLKPENIMRTTSGRVKILDFGLAREMSAASRPTMTQLTQAGTAVGTPGYMAPEQMSGGSVDARTDVFAFGVLATELGTGEHPFGADSAAMLRRMTLLMEGRPVSTPTGWSAPDVEQVARRCIRADPAERYPSGIELAAALRAALAAPPDARSSPNEAMWWWQFHQAAIAVILAALPAAAWMMRASIGRPRGSWLFFASLVLATVSISARMNLLFTSRVSPRNLEEQRRLVIRWVAAIDVTLAALMIVAAALLAGERDELAGLAVTLATVVIASVAVIEPATTRAAKLDGEA